MELRMVSSQKPHIRRIDNVFHWNLDILLTRIYEALIMFLSTITYNAGTEAVHRNPRYIEVPLYFIFLVPKIVVGSFCFPFNVCKMEGLNILIRRT